MKSGIAVLPIQLIECTTTYSMYGFQMYYEITRKITDYNIVTSLSDIKSHKHNMLSSLLFRCIRIN